jgi:hypothetical protein
VPWVAHAAIMGPMWCCHLAYVPQKPQGAFIALLQSGLRQRSEHRLLNPRDTPRALLMCSYSASL